MSQTSKMSLSFPLKVQNSHRTIIIFFEIALNLKNLWLVGWLLLFDSTCVVLFFVCVFVIVNTTYRQCHQHHKHKTQYIISTWTFTQKRDTLKCIIVCLGSVWLYTLFLFHYFYDYYFIFTSYLLYTTATTTFLSDFFLLFSVCCLSKFSFIIFFIIIFYFFFYFTVTSHVSSFASFASFYCLLLFAFCLCLLLLLLEYVLNVIALEYFSFYYFMNESFIKSFVL